jgi:ABC-2 type transport system permease protein
VVGIFVRLKLRLLANGLQDTARLVGFAIGAAFTLAMTPLATIGWLGLRDSPELAADVGVVVFTAIALAWVILPLGLFGTDDTLDPARFAALPLRPRTLVTGLYVGAFVGLAPLATTALLAGSVFGLSDGPGSMVIALLALALEVALCVAVSRALASALSGILRSRRGRDLAVLVGVLIGGSGQLVMLGTAYVSGSADLVHSAASVLRWAPPGMTAWAAADAAAGHYLPAIAGLAGAALADALLLLWWGRTLTGAMVTTDASTARSARPTGRRAWLQRVHPGGRAGAVAVRELRYNWREPRRRSAWVAAVLFGGIGPFLLLRQDGAGAGGVYVVCLTAGIVGLQAANQLGVDGPATWMHAATWRGPRDIRADFAGRNLALALIGAPILLVIAVALAAIAGSAGSALEPFVLACAVLGIAFGVGNVASALAPFPVPESTTNVFSGANTGQGCLAGVVVIGSMAGTGLLSLPLLAAPLLTRLDRPGQAAVVYLGGIGYGLVVAWLGRYLAGAMVYGRQPELLGLLTRREAG